MFILWHFVKMGMFILGAITIMDNVEEEIVAQVIWLSFLAQE
jgi:hypothetical protein